MCSHDPRHAVNHSLRCLVCLQWAPCRGRQVALDIAEGLDYLHSKLGVLHSDIKSRQAGRAARFPLHNSSRVPAVRNCTGYHASSHDHLPPCRASYPRAPCSNVLLSDSLRASLSDFEMAQLMTASSRAAKGYSLLYAAPEQLAGQHCELAVDLYGFGVVLLELTTGQLVRTRAELRLPQAPCDCPQVRDGVCMRWGTLQCLPCLQRLPLRRPHTRPHAVCVSS